MRLPVKFVVTPELAKALKTLRVGNDLSSKDLAEHIGKSPSYVTKLEKGSIRRIEQEVLTEILLFVTCSESFYEQALPAVVSVLSGMLDGGRPFEQVWLMQYDVSDRPVRLSSDMVADMSERLRAIGVSAEELVKLMNANIDSQAPLSFPANQVTLVDCDGMPRMLSRISLSLDEVEGVFGGTADTVPYFMLYSIVHSLHREEQFPGVRKKLPPESAISVLRSTDAYMEKWGVRSLMGYSHFLASDEFVLQQLPLVSSGEGVVDRLADQLREFFEYDSLQALSSLNNLCETLEWDPAFAMKLFGIPFADLGETSYTNKRRLLEEIQQAFNRYNQMGDFDKRIETY